jgi:predicted solute-binding protein
VNSNEQILATLDMTVYMAINSYHNPVTQKLEIARTDPKTTTDFLSKRMKEKSDEEFQTFVKMVMLVQNQNIVEKSIGDAKTLRHLATQIELASTILQPGGES